MKNKINLKMITFIFWTILIGTAIFYSIKDVIQSIQTSEIDISTFGTKEYITMFIMMFLSLIFYIVKSALNYYWLIAIYIGIKMAYKKFYKEKLDIIDFKNDDYYREIISNYSPGVLSYIDDFKLSQKDIVATLMSLEMKKKIKIEDTIKLINESEENLDENEKYILDNIKNNNLNNINLLTFEEKVVRDCINSNLLKKKIQKKNSVFSCVLVYLVIITICVEVPFWFENFLLDNGFILLLFLLTMFISFLALVIFPIAAIIYFKSYYTMNRINPYIRNQKAKEINGKLEGLKKYISDYSLLDQKEYKELLLWEDYLIYSVILGQNTKIVEDITKIFNK